METDLGYNRFNKFKVLMHAENIEGFLKNKIPKPIVTDLELSNFCDQQCVWCEPAEYRIQNMQMLSPETITKAILDIATLESRMVRFCGGGEPMTNPFFKEALKLARQQQLGIICNSNGTLIYENLDVIIGCCHYLRISLDAATPETHKKLHRTESDVKFDEIIAGLKELIKERRKERSKLEIGAAFLIHYDNHKEVSAFARLMCEIEIDFVQFRPVYLTSKDENQRLLAVIDEAMEKVEESRREFESRNFKIFGITRKMEGVWFGRRWHKCYSPFFLPVLGASGKIYACCDRRDIVLGDFAKDGFANIYTSKEYKERTLAINVDKCIRCTSCDLNEVIHFCFEKDCLKRDLL